MFDNKNKDYEVDGETIDLALWDTAGQEDFSRIRPLSYIDTDVLLITFAFDNKVSFDNIKSKWMDEVKRYCADSAAVIVGTKFDLPAEKKEVTVEEGNALATSLGAAGFVECSAKSAHNLEKVFQTAVRAAIAKKNKKPGGKQKCTIL